jgi:predicted transcriptional regulator
MKGEVIMADQYIEDTKKRYRKDRTRFNDVQDKIKELNNEAEELHSMISAYSRILRNALGTDAVRRLDEEIDSINNKNSGISSKAVNQALREFDPIEPTITDDILSLVKRSGEGGITAGEVISELEQKGIGAEKRNTIYGTLSRLKTMKRVNKVGDKFFATKAS